MNLKDAVMVMFQTRLEELSQAVKKAYDTNDAINIDVRTGKLDLIEGKSGALRDNLLVARTVLSSIRDFSTVLQVKGEETESNCLLPFEAGELRAATGTDGEVYHKTAERRAYLFTFGSDHPLRNRAQRIWAFSMCRAREIMARFYGDKWAFCYGPHETFVVGKTDLSGGNRVVQLPRVMQLPIRGQAKNELVSHAYHLTDNDLVEDLE